MSRAGLARIWGILGALLAAYAIGTWIILQGGKSFADIPGLEAKAPVTSAYLAVHIIGILLGILSAVGVSFMRTKPADGEGLFPVVAVADAGPHRMASWSMSLYQFFFVAVFLLIPGAALYRLNAVILQRGILWHEGDPGLGSIVLKNAYGLTRGASDADAAENACASRVMRDDGFTWLANMRCDPAKAKRLKPFNKDGSGLADDAAAAPASCVRDLAMTQGRQQQCEGVRDVSEECEGAERRCRGIQWLPVVSPLLLVATTGFGWVMLGWLLVEATYRKLRTAAAAKH